MDEWPEPETLKSPCLCTELMLCSAVLDIVEKAELLDCVWCFRLIKPGRQRWMNCVEGNGALFVFAQLIFFFFADKSVE